MPMTKKDLLNALVKDYGTSSNESSYTLKKQCDKLARFAYMAMKTLEDNNIQDFILLENDDLRQWYHDYKQALRQAQQAAEAKVRRAEVRAQALARLTDEEKEALGLKRK